MNFTAAAALTSGFSPPSNSNGGRSQFELRVGPFVGNELTVAFFKGREVINEPFVYDVTFSSSLSEGELHIGTRGLPACLSIHTPKPHAPRVIQGLVVDFKVTDTPTNELASGRCRYAARIAPRLWTLQNNSHRRIFRGKTAVDIACAVLKEYGIVPDVQLRKADYAPLPFEYQNNETDLAFIGRVLAAAGIFYFFRHASGLLDALVPGGGVAAAEVGALAGAAAGFGGAVAQASGFISDAESKLGLVTTLVLSDRASDTEQLEDTSLDVAKVGLDAAGGAATVAVGAFGGAASVISGVVGIGAGQSDSLVYDANGQAGYTDSERIFSFSLGDPLVPKQIQLRHWNIKDATSYTANTNVAPVSAGVSLDAIASISLTQPSTFGLNAASNVAVDSPSIASSEASVFEYARDLSLQNAPVSEELQVASRALAQARADGLPGQGTTDCRRLAPGYRFALQKHPVAALNAEYLVTEIVCEGSSPDHNPDPKARDYQCSFRCVPSRVNPLPKKPAPRTHSPEPAVVIGPNWGDIYCDDMQRILVRFRWMPGDAYSEDGEGVCRVQLLDPWGGHGYGIRAIPRVGTEVMVAFFEGGEPIAIGQLRSRVNRPAFDSPHEVTKVGIKSRVIPNGGESEISIDDHPDKNKILIRSTGELVTEVRSDTTATHSANYSVEITGDRREVTAGGATLIYDKDVTTDILGNLQDQVAKDRVMVTDGSVTDWIGGDLSKSVGGCVESMIQGDHEAVFEANSLERHYGHHTVVVAAQGADGHASASFHVEGPARAYARKEIEVTSPEGFTFSCGDSHITVRKDSVTIASPTIVLVGKTVQVTASDTAAVAAKTATVAGSDSVTVSGANTATLAGQSATVVLDSNATIEGSKVKLGSGGSGPTSQKQQSKPKTISTLKLSDADGNPLPSQRVILRKGGDGGDERLVVLDTNGAIDVEGDDSFDVFFPDTPNAKS